MNHPNDEQQKITQGAIYIPNVTYDDHGGPTCDAEFTFGEIEYAPKPDGYGETVSCELPKGHKGAHIDSSMAGRIAWMTYKETLASAPSPEVKQEAGEIDGRRFRLRGIAAYIEQHDGHAPLYSVECLREVADYLQSISAPIPEPSEPQTFDIEAAVSAVSALIEFGAHTAYCQTMKPESNSVCTCGRDEAVADGMKVREAFAAGRRSRP